VITRRETSSLLFVALLAFLTGCRPGPAAKPELPESVSPGWRLASYVDSPVPPGVPVVSPPQCWKARYEGAGTAEIWVCGYRVSGGAFDAAQRTPAAAQAVKFQEGNYLVLVKWNGVPKTNLTALIRAIQKTLSPK